MKISDEAVETVAAKLYPDLFSGESLLPEVLRNSGRWQRRHEVRAALEAAAPYLEPAGDGGLREALEKLAGRLRNSACEEAADWGAGGAYSDAAGALEAMLAAHPAAPAVPLPVDREALIQVIAEYIDDLDNVPAMGSPADHLERRAVHVANAVLALLGGSAGEQVEP